MINNLWIATPTLSARNDEMGENLNKKRVNLQGIFMKEAQK